MKNIFLDNYKQSAVDVLYNVLTKNGLENVSKLSLSLFVDMIVNASTESAAGLVERALFKDEM